MIAQAKNSPLSLNQTLSPGKHGWDLLPDKAKLEDIAIQIADKLIRTLEKKGECCKLLRSRLLTALSAQTEQQVYELYRLYHGASIPRFSCGQIGDIAKVLKTKMVSYLSSHTSIQLENSFKRNV